MRYALPLHRQSRPRSRAGRRRSRFLAAVIAACAGVATLELGVMNALWHPPGTPAWQAWILICLCNAVGFIVVTSAVMAGSRRVRRWLRSRTFIRPRPPDSRLALSRAAQLVSVGRITAAIAHEAAQPLGAILNNAETAAFLLESAAPTLDEIKAIVADIRDDSVRAMQVIQRTRALLQDRQLQSEPLDLNVIVSEVVELLRSQAQQRRIGIGVRYGTVPHVCADPVQVRQLLLNLVLNAMDAINGGPATTRHIEIRTLVSGSMVAVHIIDTGCGIAPDQLTKLFEPFFTSKADGLGLGLSIARAIVTAHGGSIGAENNERGPGATFRFELPAVAVPAQARHR